MAAVRAVSVLMGLPVMLSTGAAPVPLVSMATHVNEVEL